MSYSADDAPPQTLSDDQLFLDLVGRLSPDWRRVVGVLIKKVAAVEDEAAALSLIEDISSILARPETTH